MHIIYNHCASHMFPGTAAQGTKYNIPVRLWLPEGYPRAAPLAYVVPTPEMVIKPHHSFVDPSGQVHSSYLRNWTAPRCAPLPWF